MTEWSWINNIVYNFGAEGLGLTTNNSWTQPLTAVLYSAASQTPELEASGAGEVVRKNTSYLGVVNASEDEENSVGKIPFSAFQRFFPRLRRRLPRRDTLLSDQIAVGSDSSANKIDPYLGVMNATGDEEKTLQRFHSQLSDTFLVSGYFHDAEIWMDCSSLFATEWSDQIAPGVNPTAI